MKSAWIIGGAILLAAVLIVGAQFYFRDQDRKCESWQNAVRSLAQMRDQAPIEVVGELGDPPGDCALP